MDKLEKVIKDLPFVAEMIFAMYKDATDKNDISVLHDHYVCVTDALELLKEQQPKNGKWVGINEYVYHLEQETGERYCVSAYYDGDLFCNQCWTAHRKTKYNFCPNCGADMRGEQE